LRGLLFLKMSAGNAAFHSTSIDVDRPKRPIHATSFSYTSIALEHVLQMQAHHAKTTDQATDIKNLIHQVICQYEKLEVGVFPMTETVLKRRRQPCGIFFCLHGPRSVKITAIWDSERNSVLFYGASGERFLKLDLGSSSGMEALVA